MSQREHDRYNDAYEDYDSYADDDGYQDTASHASYLRDDVGAWRYGLRSESQSFIEQALDWGFSGSVLAILVLSALYIFFPDDVMIPFAGRADDLAAVLAASGTVGFLTVMRLILRMRVGRWGCLVAIVFSAISAFIVFWTLTLLLSTAF